MSAPVLYAVNGPRATITLNRPAALNALSADLRAQLSAATREAEADPQVRVVVLRGAGDRAFCAGADIHEFTESESLVGTRARRHSGTWNDVVAACTKPTLAAIHGYCLGGGVELALACDLRIAAPDASFAFPEVGLGLLPGAGGTQRLPRLIGVGPALDLVLTGRRIDAHEALRLGLVSAVTGEGLEHAVDEWVERLTKAAPVAYAYAKEAIVRGAGMSLQDGLALEADLATVLTNTSDRLERVEAFKEGKAR